MKYNELKDAGLENLLRSKNKLLRTGAAIKWLCSVEKLSMETIDKFHLGIAEPFKQKGNRLCVNSLSIPVIGSDGKPKRRRIYYNIPKVTVNPKTKTVWGCGTPTVYYSCSVQNKKRVFVCSDVGQLWRLDQKCVQENSLLDILFVTSTQPDLIPEEFKQPEFWTQFDEIYFGQSSNEDGNVAAENLRKFCFADVKRILTPEGINDWTDFFSTGGTAEQFSQLLDDGRIMSSGVVQVSESVASLGEFAIDSVNCNGAFVGGYLYYPYRVEKREIERLKGRDGTITEAAVTSYITKVVRSDGAVLEISYLPAPRGTPISERVLALSDGTRIEQVPRPNLYATWHLDSITDFIHNRQIGKKILNRPLEKILADLEAHFRRSVWLPFEDDYAVLVLYIALSYVYNVFEAIPLLIVCGPKGTGKTDLGLAIESVAFNAKTLGQSSAASAVRIIHESRGLIVWDDLEAITAKGNKNVFSDVHQMLKLSYKKKTSKKSITARNGQTSIFDFYGPKVINNTQGVDPILGSRMVTIRTRKLPFELRGKWDLTGSDLDFTFALRNELHVWGMAAAAEIHKRYRQMLPEQRGDRREEILTPLQVIAELAVDVNIIERLNRSQLRENSPPVESVEPTDVLKHALQNCIADGYTFEVALPHIQLQMALWIAQNPSSVELTRIPFWLQPQWIGSSMDSCNFKENSIPVRRARLYGKETRIYRLREQFVRNVFDLTSSDESLSSSSQSKNPFDFCVKISCGACPFKNICEETVPGLKLAKYRRLRFAF